jgi:hypothetical protein
VSVMLRYWTTLFPPPTLSLIIASAFNLCAAFILPWTGLRLVGVGTAALSTRVSVVLMEAALVLVSVGMFPSVSIFDVYSMTRQAFVLVVYMWVLRIYHKNAPSVYLVDIPKSVKDMGIRDVIRGRIRAPLFPSPDQTTHD